MESNKLNSVCALIVVYNDYESLAVLIESLLNQVDMIVVVDNSDNGKMVPDGVIDQPAVLYYQAGENRGLAVGLNEGVRLCCKKSPAWILLLDQDSVVTENMISCMLEEYRQRPNKSEIGMLCPSVFLSDKGVFQSPLKFGSIFVSKVEATSDDVDFSISSGSMIKAPLFEEIGQMEEEFFIEYIDYDFCLRLRSCNYNILFVKKALLLHKLGETRLSKVGIRYTYHHPQRLYYQTRNRLVVIRRYGVRFRSFMLMQLSLLVLKFFKVLIIEDQKLVRLKFYFAGIRDGIGGLKKIKPGRSL